MNTFKERKELTFYFHLYTDDPQYNIPGVIEYGYDVEFNSRCRMPVINAAQETMYRTAHDRLAINKEDSFDSIMLTRIAYEDKEEKFQYVFNFLTDTCPWDQRDPVVSSDRKKLVDNGELGQSWWIHHVNLPNAIIDRDTLTDSDLEFIQDAVRKDVSEFLKLML